jgi:hypothetical protein
MLVTKSNPVGDRWEAGERHQGRDIQRRDHRVGRQSQTEKPKEESERRE